MKKNINILISALASLALAAGLAGCGSTETEPVQDKAPDGILFTATADGYDKETSTPAFVSVVPVELDEEQALSIEEDATVSYFELAIGEDSYIELDDGTYELGYVSPINKDGSIYKVDKDKAVIDISVASDGATLLGSDDELSSIDVAFDHVDAKDVTAEELTSALTATTIAANACETTKDDAKDIVELATANVKANPNAEADAIDKAVEQAETIAASDEGVKAAAAASVATSTPSADTGGGSASAPSASAPSAPAAPSHTHSFSIPVTQTQQVLVQPGYDTYVCTTCGAAYSDGYSIMDHLVASNHASDTIVSVPPVYDYQEVTVGYKCSCGAMG